MYMHAYIAYIFVAVCGGKQPVTKIQSHFKYSILLVVLLSLLSAALIAAAYQTLINANPLLLEIFCSAACLCFVVSLLCFNFVGHKFVCTEENGRTGMHTSIHQ